MKIAFLLALGLSFALFAHGQMIIDHTCTNLNTIPADAIVQAKATLHITYGHTSHGSQLTEGMAGLIGETSLVGYKGDIYQFNNGGEGGALDLEDYYGGFPGGAEDLGNPDFTTWATATRNFLNDPGNANVNVIIWSWCGQVSWASESDIDNYLAMVTDLEDDFPNVHFVYMTGHRDIGSDASLKANNQRIRDYCVANHKTLYDFADIESYNPDGQYFEFASDDCSYYNSSGDPLGNWAQEWQNSHTEGVDWYSCGSAHSEPLNANRKAYAAWWLWARLAGWNPAGGEGEGEGEFEFTRVPRGGWFEEGDALSLQVSVTGAVAPVHYQWIKDNSDLFGETDDTFAIDNLTLDDEGWYSCRVEDASKGTRETPPANVQVFPADSLPAPGIAGLLLAGSACVVLGGRRILQRKR